MKKGKVYLVGAGPGDEGLLTLKAKKKIEEADVIVYDRLVNPTIILLAKQDAELIYAGKLPKRHIMRQENINQTLIEKGAEGKIVVRLKGGDPSVFGRVGEEAESLAQAGISFEIVPGITSSIAAASYAGIPVTHREYGSTFTVVTGHDKSTLGHPSIEWDSLAKGIDTIAFYMGISNIKYISDQLIKHGRSPKTPVALIQWGTYGRQKTLEGTLETIADEVEKTNFQNPAITLVGDIIALRKKIQWFEEKPLIGKQILLARTSSEKSLAEERLRDLGADVFSYPSFKEVPIYQFNDGLDDLLIHKVSEYDTIVFTSPDSIRSFFEWLNKKQLDIRAVKARFQVLSEKSFKVIRSFGCMAEKVSEVGVVSNQLIVGEKKTVAGYGKEDIFITHETKVSKASQMVLQRMIDDQMLSTIVFPSAKAVVELLSGAEQISPQFAKDLFKMKAVCFGEKSAQAAKDAGFTIEHILKDPTYSTLIEYFATQSLSRL